MESVFDYLLNSFYRIKKNIERLPRYDVFRETQLLKHAKTDMGSVCGLAAGGFSSDFNEKGLFELGINRVITSEVCFFLISKIRKKVEHPNIYSGRVVFIFLQFQ